MSERPRPPVVLVIAGNDPSGGAGMCADVQTITALSAHPAPVLTALTVQDTRNAYRVEAIAAELVVAQARAVLEDMPVAAIKLGLLGSAEIGVAVAELIEPLALPVVLDPVLVAAGGAQLAESALREVICARLVPLATILTPNAYESRALFPQAESRDERAAALTKAGAEYVLIKGADEESPEVHNVLYDQAGEVEHFTWSRLPHAYHGSGCTLAAAIAALLAHGRPPTVAIESAQRYTWEALRRAYRPGQGQHVPHRFFHVPDLPRK